VAVNFAKVPKKRQPIGLEIPAYLDWSKPVALTVWLHGRGDKVTDMHFLVERLHKPGQFQPGTGIILHPFGRQCLGFQLAGEPIPFGPLIPYERTGSHRFVESARIRPFGQWT